jgi:hypothetical protein
VDLLRAKARIDFWELHAALKRRSSTALHVPVSFHKRAFLYWKRAGHVIWIA